MTNTYWVIKYIISIYGNRISDNNNNNSKETLNIIRLKQILTNSMALDLFMSHLAYGLLELHLCTLVIY